MKRTTFLLSAGGVVAGGVLGTFAPRAADAQPLERLTPVDVALENVTRTTVGLRPYRASGFVLRADGHDAKTVIHNYGHGGGGMSLSWGVAMLASRLALQTEKRRVAVLGSGVIGLSTARVLQDAGFDVAIYTRDVPPNTTSNLSGAQWTPTSLFTDGAIDDAFRRQFIEASTLAYGRFQTFLGDDYGVRWIENFDCHDEADASILTVGTARLITNLYPEVHTFGPGEHPFPRRYATRFLTMLIEPNRYLRALQRDYLARGGRTVIRSFVSASDMLTLDEPLIVNCTGLGAKALTGDSQLEPVRGQLSILAPQPAVNYIALFENRYMFPRSDGIVLGGTFQHGNADLVPDPATVRTVVADQAAFFGKMHA